MTPIDEAQHWARLYADGMTVEQIALKAGRSASTVRKWLHRLGVEMRPPGERPSVERRPSTRSGDTRGSREPAARIVRPSVQRMYR